MRRTTLALSIAGCSLAATALTGPVPAQASPVSLTVISTAFQTPIGIDHHEPTNRVALSANYPSGSPYNLELVAADGSHSPFSGLSGLTDELKIATVRSGPCQAGFLAGQLFTGNGVAGQVVRVSPDGTSVQNPWVTLPGESGLMRGGLFHDRYCAFGGDLLVATTSGGVWRITAAGVPTKVAQVPTHLEGISTIPADPRYGPWAGTALIGAEAQGRFYAVTPEGAVTPYELGIQPEDIDLIPANENFFGVNYGQGQLMGAPASQFASMVGNVLVTQEFPGILWNVSFNGTSFVKEEIARVTQWEHVTFSPAGIVEVPPADEAPVAHAGDDLTVPEGSSVPLAGSGSDEAPGTLTYSWSPAARLDDATSPTPTYTGLDDTVDTLTLTVTDAGGQSDSDTTQVTVTNVEPVISSLTTSATLVPVGSPVTASTAFTDAGSADTHTSVFSWGDASSSSVATGAPASGASATHSYTAPGVYELGVVVTDDDGGVDSAALDGYIVVYDPSGGFVTGGGRIASPAGAYRDDPTATGTASFGFVSKYKRGASVPTGSTEFQFQAGDLNFHSDSYEWLVVAGQKAQFKGTGTVNGVPGFGFMVTAVDGGSGSADRFRMKITDSAGTLYDNQSGASDSATPTTQLLGGSIVVHRG